MPEILDIYNQALSTMGGRSTVASVLETSPETKEITRHYNRTLKQLLVSALWGFARRSALLTVYKAAFGAPGAPGGTGATWDVTWPDPPWAYEYKFPTDCLRPRYLMPNPGSTYGAAISPMSSHDAYYALNPPYEFVVGSDVDTVLDPDEPIKTVLCNLQAPILVYTALVEDPDAWDPLFEQAFVYMLASRIAIPLGADREVMKLNIQLGAATLQQAQVLNANTGINAGQSIPDWLKGRVAVPEGGMV